LSVEFVVAETDTFRKIIALPRFGSLYFKIKNYVYPQLRKNPYYGPNIKKLKGELAHLYRYRLGDYHLLYSINTNRVMIFIITLKKRSEAYSQ
jgi:mRNA interferase RelE/StbE